MTTHRQFLSAIRPSRTSRTVLAGFVVLLAVAATADGGSSNGGDFPPAKSPEEALASMRPRPGFQVDLVAAEPLVMDPIAFDWGPDGKLWVVEMADYPLGIDGQGKPGGRVRFLEDTIGDGKYDTSTVFLDGLSFPNGVIAWRSGVLISAAPDILYAEDRDGDGRCDFRQTLYHGFSLHNPQHLMNGFAWGLDNWLYCGGDQQPAEVVSDQTGETVSLGKRDFKIRPDDGGLLPVTGQTQFVRSRDDWGNWFGSTNSNPGFHFALVDHYLRRNPYFNPPDALVQLSNVPGAAPVYPSSETVARFNDLNKTNRFTSACGLTIYRDTLFGPEFYGNTFVSEPVHNLVHREILSPSGATFSSRRAADEASIEFLSSTDNWFRPAMLRTGPDGALWVADMYRQVIEHPEWIPDDWEAQLDLRGGHRLGRLYRVFPEGAKLRKIPRTAEMETGELVELLESENGTIRDMAHQMLLWRDDTDAKAPLTAMVRTHPSAATRLQALCVLDGLDALDTSLLLKALRDDHSGVRRHAIRLSEARLNGSESLRGAVTSLTADQDPQVKMQLAYSLGECGSKACGVALGTLLADAEPGSFLHAAAMSSVLPRLSDVSGGLFAASSDPRPQTVRDLLETAAASSDDAAVALILSKLEAKPNGGDAIDAAWRFEAAAGLYEGLRHRRISLAKYQQQADRSLKQKLASFSKLVDEARTIVRSAERPVSERAAALDLLGFDESDSSREALRQLLGPQSPVELQNRSIDALGRHSDIATAEALLAQWRSFGPQVRSRALDVLMSRPQWQRELLGAVKAGAVMPADIDAARRQALTSHSNDAIREMAVEVLGGASDETREQVLAEYRAADHLPRDARRGEEVFKRLCANCHRVGGLGTPVGPDLTALTDRSLEAMRIAVLDPNRAVESKFVSFTALGLDGRVQTGLLVSETGSSVELLAAEGRRHVLLRRELDVLQSSGKSLMPDGLEKDMSPQDLADVTAFVHEQSEPPKTIAGNQPAVIEGEALRGEFWLLPQNAEVYGPTLTIEDKYANLGQWLSESDRAVWTVRVESGGDFRLSLEYACADESAGQPFVVEVAGQRVRATSENTGGWNAYREMRLGTIHLEPGTHRVAVRPTGPLQSELFDLKTARLRPE